MNRERPSRIFKRYVQRDPTVCNNCFRRRYDLYVAQGKWQRERELWTPRPQNNRDVHNDVPAHGQSNGCECGYLDGSKQRPLPEPLAVEYARNIASVLREESIAFDADVLVEEVERRKAQPEAQGREDSHVFKPAVAEAVRHARTNDDGPLVLSSA